MLDSIDHHLLAVLADGLPICSQPYAMLGQWLGLTEVEVIERIQRLQTQGVIKRFGVIVKHAAVGYRHNAMVVWHVPEAKMDETAAQLLAFSFVTLCYQRPMLAQWPYNLYCMIHGKTQDRVLEQIKQLNETCELAERPQQVLFSKRCFKQRGAIYAYNNGDIL